MKLESKKDVIGVALARLVRFLLPIRSAACSHRFDPADMENHREIDGTIKWSCWKCGKQFSESCGLEVLAHGSVEKRPDRPGDLWGFSKPNMNYPDQNSR
jgi:hypothetical protein